MKEQLFDAYNLRDIILSCPKDLEKGKDFVRDFDSTPFTGKSFSNLIICGMGGSALPGELLANIYANLEEINSTLPIYLSRTYALPKAVNENSLIFVNSYSGNTEETVSCFEEALKRNISVIAFSAGGKLEKLAKDNSVPHINTKIDKEHFQPRYGTAFVAVAMSEVLTKIGLFDRIQRFPILNAEDSEEQGKKMALMTTGKTPVFYSSERFKIACKIWKIKVNENSKTPAFWNYFPELNHNEMVGFTNPQAKFIVFMVEDEKDHPQTKKRILITADLYRKKGVEVEIIQTKGETYLEKLFNLMTLSDWHSYYLAQNYQIDPTPVDMVEDLKTQLG